MSRRWKDQVTAGIRRLRGLQERGRERQLLQGEEPMQNECMTCAVQESYAAIACAETDTCLAPVEAVARALGYTGRELAVAKNLLNQFAWRYPTGSPQSNPEPIEAEAMDAQRGRRHVA
jgi:hypothetical protein